MRRHLAAVLAADIVGYARLMGADEAATLNELRSLRSKLLGPMVASKRGEIIKSMGDGWLIVFASALDAVECAMQVQDRLANHPTIRLRIGIHVGDIVHEGEDIFGDGVNLAARLQNFAHPGSLAISDQTYSSLDGTLTPSFEDAGSQSLKNIERPVRIWTRAGDNAGLSPHAVQRRRSGRFPRLVLSSVQTSDQRAEVQELAAALTSDLATYLDSPGWLITLIGEEPDAKAHALKTALRTNGDRLRVEARLCAPSGTFLWSAKFDGVLAERFDLQDSVSEAVAANVIGLIFDTERRRLSETEPDAMTASDCVLAGILARTDLSADALGRALTYYRRAVNLDPTLAQAYAEAINVYRGAANFGYTQVARAFRQDFEAWLTASTPLAASNASLDLGHAWIAYTRDRDAAALRSKLEEHLRLSPFDPEVLHLCCIRYTILGEPKQALDCYRRFERLGRFSPFRKATAAVAGLAQLQLGRDEAAIALAESALVKARNFSSPYRILAAANAHLGRSEEAEKAVARILELNPEETASSIFRRLAYADVPANQRFRDGLLRAGLPE